MKVYRYLTGKDDVKFNGTGVIVGQAIVKQVVDESEVPQGTRAEGCFTTLVILKGFNKYQRVRSLFQDELCL